MFPALLSEVDARYEAILQFFKATQALGPNEAVVAKGLVFVQIYAVYEYTINRAVSEAIEAVKGHRPKLVDMLPSLLAVYLDPELTSLRDVSRANEWDRRIRLMERAFSSKFADLPSATIMPSDGSHYRINQLKLIFRVVWHHTVARHEETAYTAHHGGRRPQKRDRPRPRDGRGNRPALYAFGDSHSHQANAECVPALGSRVRQVLRRPTEASEVTGCGYCRGRADGARRGEARGDFLWCGEPGGDPGRPRCLQ